MKRKHRYLAQSCLVGALAALCAATLSAKACEGVTFPDDTQVAGRSLALNGLGLRQATMLKVNVYVAALYVASVSTDPEALLAASTAKELVLHFVRDAGADDLREAWEDGFEKAAKGQLSALEQRIETLNGWMEDMKVGQRLTFTHTPGAGVEVNVNGSVKGTVEGDDFARAFLSIWLGARPPNAELKAGLLGSVCG